MRAADLYHVGVVVDDLPNAMDQMSKVGGYRWTTLIEHPLQFRSPTGDHETTVRFVYSIDAPHVELVQSIPGTAWTAAPGNAPHHIGYFVDGLAATSAALVDAGLPVEVCGRVGEEAPAMFAYHKGRDGIRIEIVDRAAMGDWQTFLSNHSAPH